MVRYDSTMSLSLRVPTCPLSLSKSTMMKSDDVGIIFFFSAGQHTYIHDLVVSVTAFVGPSILFVQ